MSAVKLKAAEAHTNFFVEYYMDIDSNARSAVINRYLESLRSNNQPIRIGFAQATGRRPRQIITMSKQTVDFVCVY